jgi:hypothetical protein
MSYYEKGMGAKIVAELNKERLTFIGGTGLLAIQLRDTCLFADAAATRIAELVALLTELIDIEGPQPGHVEWFRRVQAAIANSSAQGTAKGNEQAQALEARIAQLDGALREILDGEYSSKGAHMIAREALGSSVETEVAPTPEHAKTGTYVTIACEDCGAQADLPRVGKEGEFMSLQPAKGWQLYPKHLCPGCQANRGAKDV